MRWIALLVLVPALVRAAPLPSFVTVPPALRGDQDSFAEEEWGEDVFPVVEDSDQTVKRGHHWFAWVPFTGLPADMEDNDVWAKIKPALVGGGWTIVKEFDLNPFSATAHLTKGGHDAWAYIKIASAGDVTINVVDVVQQPLKFTIPAPAAQPEKVAQDHGDFPYLPPLPGSTETDATWLPEDPFMAPVPGSDEQQLVATGLMRRSYTRRGTSNVQFATVYRDALKAAGWNIVEYVQGLNAGDAGVMAHYAKNGRDLWANLHITGAGDYGITVADAGTVDLAAKLAKECHVPLYGVLFDFNKSTLRPESDGVLARAAQALKANPKLAVEVQGHTDNVGKDDYNVTLSEARAKSVLQWLVKNGVPASQLTSRGYGKSRPVATNDDDAGRAKNRRVELSCRK